MLSLSEMLTNIKMDLGIYSLHLPIEDEDMYMVIKQRSLKTYSQFFPHVVTVKINLSDMKHYENTFQKKTIEIPDYFGGRRIMQVIEVDLDSSFVNAGYMSPDMTGSVESFKNFSLNIANINALSTLAPAFTFEFEAPNRLSLYNLHNYSNMLEVRLGVEHFENLSSIPPTAMETFYELALIDVKNYAYGILKHYDDISTPYGTISLKIDDWQNARDDRKSLIDEWRSKAYIDTTSIYFH